MVSKSTSSLSLYLQVKLPKRLICGSSKCSKLPQQESTPPHTSLESLALMVEKRAKNKRMALEMMLNKEQQSRKRHKDRPLKLNKGPKLKLRKPKIELRRKGVDKRRSVARRRLLNKRNN